MQETLQCLDHHISSDPSLLERQRARLQWQQEESYSAIENLLSFPAAHTINGLAHGWPDLSTPHFPVLQEEEDVVAATVSTSSMAVEKETKSSKKRKADKPPPMLVSGNALEKKVKGEAAGVTKAEPQQSNQTEISDDSSKDKPKAPQKPDYIHVRARRGQATDSHSLAERVRRERISERMKFLQGLVPGCNKITGKAGMLDEIINYVQSLQRQVEFLSMKLAAVNPRLDFNMENFYSKEMNLACNSGISTVGISSDLLDSSYLQCSLLQQADMAMIPSNVALSRTISPPMSAADTESCYNVHRPSSGWDSSMQNIYGPSTQFHQLQGSLLPSNLKMEM